MIYVHYERIRETFIENATVGRCGEKNVSHTHSYTPHVFISAARRTISVGKGKVLYKSLSFSCLVRSAAIEAISWLQVNNSTLPPPIHPIRWRQIHLIHLFSEPHSLVHTLALIHTHTVTFVSLSPIMRIPRARVPGETGRQTDCEKQKKRTQIRRLVMKIAYTFI